MRKASTAVMYVCCGMYVMHAGTLKDLLAEQYRQHEMLTKGASTCELLSMSCPMCCCKHWQWWQSAGKDTLVIFKVAGD